MSQASTTGSLFEPRRPGGCRVAVTGQVGVDKKPFLEKLAELARTREQQVKLFHVGDLMYAEAPDVRPGRILDLPLARLIALASRSAWSLPRANSCACSRPRAASG